MCGLKLCKEAEKEFAPESHPAWVCGLKQQASFVSGKWETSHPAWVCGLKRSESLKTHCANCVTPCVGVWIETEMRWYFRPVVLSHPAWVCGLKPITRVLWKYSMSHTLRGCVDWNIRTMTAMYPYVVTPCVGVWIETTRSANFSFKSPCHTLRGCVDWN